MLIAYGVEAKKDEFSCEFKINIDSRELKITTNWKPNGNYWTFITHLTVGDATHCFEYFGDSNEVHIALQFIQAKLNKKGKVFLFNDSNTKELASFLDICQMATFPKIAPRKAKSLSFA